MLSLGIETSCDETAASVVKDGEVVLSSVIASSLKLHQKHKGIIPEIASRAHIEYISLVTAQALAKAGKGIKDIGAVCVTSGPGLLGSLLVGISFAKALCYCLKKPLIGVNHLEAHLYASFLSAHKRPHLPFIGLVVSGGHTSLFVVRPGFIFKPIGRTVDDAAGEAFDKVAKILDLGYPGGPVIERIAKRGNPYALKFSCKGSEDLGFSFSGIKTAVLYQVTRSPGVHQVAQTNVAASFQKAVVDALVEKSFRACERNKMKTLVIGGGVAANTYLRKRFENEAGLRRMKVFFPSLSLSLDNAAMIAGLGYQLYKRGERSDYYLTAGI